MLDIGWSELLLIGVAALIIIGPEELPRMFHNLGRLTARARSMAREFSSAMEDAAKSSGLDDVKKDLDGLRGLTSKKNLGLDALDRAAERFEKWEPKIPGKTAGPQPDPTMPRPIPTTPAAPATPEAKAEADEVITFRTAPTTPAAPAATPAAAPAVEPAKPVRRTAAKTRKAAPRDGDGSQDT